MSRLVLVVVAALTTAVLTALGTAALMLEHSHPEPRTPLLRNLPGRTWDSQNAGFRQRLLHQVPVGSPESDLMDVLHHAGVLRAWEPVSSRERHADLEWGTLVCNMGAHVAWTVDERDRLASLDTQYHEEGCL